MKPAELIAKLESYKDYVYDIALETYSYECSNCGDYNEDEPKSSRDIKVFSDCGIVVLKI